MTLIVFDLLSTLLNSGPRYVEAYIRVSHQYAHTTIPSRAELFDMLGEKNLKEIISACSPEVGPDKRGEFMSACNAMCDNLLFEQTDEEALFPETKQTLTSLRLTGHELGVFTGSREDTMVAQLYHYGLAGFFKPQYIEGKNNERDGMLDTVALKTMQLRRIKRNYSDAMMVVGDSVADFAASKNIGTTFIAIARTEKAKKKFEEAGATIIISSLRDILSLPAVNFNQSPFLPEARLVP